MSPAYGATSNTLWYDWCLATDHPSHEVTDEAVAAFWRDLPASPRTLRARTPAEPTTHAPDVSPILPTVPVWRRIVGVRGRRDAFVLALLGCGLTRRQIRDISADALPTPPRGGIPRACLACAFTRWLRIVLPATRGWRVEVLDVVAPAQRDDLTTHDCDTPLPPGWEGATTLVPSIDKHGWVTDRALSTRAITAILAARRGEAARLSPDDVDTRGAWAGHRVARDIDYAQLAADYDSAAQRADELLAATELLLAVVDV